MPFCCSNFFFLHLAGCVFCVDLVMVDQMIQQPRVKRIDRSRVSEEFGLYFVLQDAVLHLAKYLRIWWCNTAPCWLNSKLMVSSWCIEIQARLSHLASLQQDICHQQFEVLCDSFLLVFLEIEVSILFDSLRKLSSTVWRLEVFVVGGFLSTESEMVRCSTWCLCETHRSRQPIN